VFCICRVSVHFDREAIVIKADLHLHTTHSRHPLFGPSGAIETWQALDRARSLELGAVAVTDHDSIEGSLAAIKIAAVWGVTVIPGVEVSSSQGHILALGVWEEIPKGRSARATIAAIHDLGGVAVAAHPCNGLISLSRRQIAVLDLDALETYNARSLFNSRARRVADQFGLAHVGGSDAHFAQEIGNGITLFPDDCRTWQDFIEAIRQGQTRSTGRRAKYFRHVAPGHLKAACQHQRERMIRHARKSILI